MYSKLALFFSVFENVLKFLFAGTSILYQDITYFEKAIRTFTIDERHVRHWYQRSSTMGEADKASFILLSNT